MAASPSPPPMQLIVAPDAGGFYVRALAASAALRLPLYRQVLGQLGLVHATRSEAHKLMLSQEPHSVGLNPGGIAEVG
jgi:hypothetical protein